MFLFLFFLGFSFSKKSNFLVYFFYGLFFLYLNYNENMISSYNICLIYYNFIFFFVFFSYFSFFWVFFLKFIPFFVIMIWFSSFIGFLLSNSLSLSLIEVNLGGFISIKMFFMEVLANLIRPLTLFLRLLINMVLGHILKLFFFWALVIQLNFFSSFFILFWGLLEIIIFFIQTHIFVTLVIFYLME